MTTVALSNVACRGCGRLMPEATAFDPTGVRFNLCVECERGELTAAIADAARAKVAGQEQAAVSHPEVRAEVDAALRRLIASRPGGTFSANDLPTELRVRASNVMGSAFTAAANARLIRDTKLREPSTLASTHAAEVRIWRVIAQEVAS